MLHGAVYFFQWSTPSLPTKIRCKTGAYLPSRGAKYAANKLAVYFAAHKI